MKKIPYLLLYVTLFHLLAGCIHEHPDDEGTDPTMLSVEVNLTLNLEWEDYQSRSKAIRSTNSYTRRFIVEVWREGQIVQRHEVVPEDFAEGQTEFLLPETLTLHAQEYSIAVWSDYVEAGSGTDLYYNTNDLRGITIQEPYIGNTGYRDCHYATAPLDLRPYRNQWNARIQQGVDMVRPLAKYRIVATDVETYHELQAAGDYPPVEELTATVLYEGFLPSSFNVAAGSPNDATTGISYAGSLPALPDDTGHVQLADDLIWVNGGDTFVTVTVLITDSQGNVVSRVPGVRIDYRRGCLTTVSGRFLTAGITSGSIHIDTDWTDDIIIEF